MKPHHNNNDIQDDVMPQTSTNGRRDEDSTSQSDKSGPAVTEPAARLSGNPQDIICGRGLHIMSHLGNIRLHSIVNRHRQTYQAASRREKAALAQRIVDEIKSTGSRFIRRAGDGRDDEWIEVDNETAYKKVGHALRLRKTFPQQKSPQARPVQEIPQHQDSNIGLSNGTMSTALQQVIGMTVAVPHNVTVHHPFTQPAFSAPDSWHPLLRNQLNPIGPMLGLQHQPQMPSPPAVNEYGQQLIANTLFASVFQSTLSALVQSTCQRGPPLQGQIRNDQGEQDGTAGPFQESTRSSGGMG